MNRFALLVGLALAATSAQALTIPYTEDFASSHANWQNNVNGLVTYQATGGPDGSSYVSAPFNFQNTEADDASVMFRGNASTPFGPASGGAFIGDWIDGGINSFSAYVRHNASEPLTYFLRVATPIGFPGFIFGGTTSVAPNVWTPIDFWISPNNPNNFDDEAPFDAVLDNIGRVQIGIFVPSGLAGVNQDFTFDLDQVTVDIPEPASLVLGSMATLLVGLLRRKSR